MLDYLSRRTGNDYRDGDDYRRGVRGSGRGRRNRRDYDDSRDYDERSNRDSRRNRDSRDNRDNRRSVDYEDYSEDYNDYSDYNDYNDYEDGKHQYGRPKMRIRKSDMKTWKHNMENADGTKGEHFDMQQVMHAAEKLNIKFDEYDEKEFCLAVNMMYSDYCKVIKKLASEDKELMVYAELAKAFLEDEDGPEPSEKLALYYYCIVDSE